MNTEKIEKLKKGLTNSQIPETLREKIRQQISRLEAEDKANEAPPKEEETPKKEEAPKSEATPKKEPAPKKEKAPKKEPAPKVAKTPVVRKPREKKVVEPKAPTTGKNTAMALAKEIRKDGEKWTDAVKRASSQMKKGTKEIKKSTNTELKKLLALVKRRKELKGISGTNLKRDSQRKAKPRGSRTVTHSGETTNQYGTYDNKLGRKYSENRDNRTDRLSPKYPKNSPLLAGGGTLYSAYTDNPLKYLSLMGAKTHSDLNYSTTKNGIDYYIGIRKDKYDDNKAIVVAFITDENNYMIDKEDAKEMSETARQKGIDKVELYTNYGVELRSTQKPQTLGFDKIIKVSGNFELGGGIDATMTYDLAGNTSGGTGGLNAGMPLSDVSGTNYTGLVGETGAMSAGEMFAGGGGVNKISFEDWLNKNNINVYKRTYYWVADDGGRDYMYSGRKSEIMKSLREDWKLNKYQNGGGLPSGAMQSYVNNYLGEGTAQGIYEHGGDLFENYQEQPEELAQIVNFYMEKFDEGDYDYEDSKNFLKEVEAIGYTFDYGLDNEPYNLRPIENEMKHGGDMHNYKEMEDNYARGGGIRTVNGREYPTGRNWTNDHRQHNKLQHYEIPKNNRK